MRRTRAPAPALADTSSDDGDLITEDCSALALQPEAASGIHAAEVVAGARGRLGAEPHPALCGVARVLPCPWQWSREWSW
jgi:hypothetical protein